MSRIHQAFENKKAFIGFVTGGDPDLETTEKLVVAMEEAGADLIEIGLPFSDPIAEGVVIQEANIRALSAGCTTDKLFDLIKRARGKVTAPMVFLTYMNPIYTYGKEKFMQRCVECGIDGLIIPDLPFEEKGELFDVCRTYGIDIISLVAPTSHERIRMIAEKAQGFLYVISSMGVTGERRQSETDIERMVKLVRESSDIPCVIGSGIATPEQAKAMASISDGAIVDNAIVKLVGRYGRESIGPVAEYVRSMKSAVKEAEIK